MIDGRATRATTLLLVLAACHNESRLDAVVEGPAVATPAPRAPLAFDPAAIDAWVDGQVRERGAVGAALVIVREGKTELARGYGVRRVDGPDPITADTPFALGSISKQFTCAAALQLADRGQLALTDTVAAHLPELTRANDITLADLGGHTSGYRDYYPLDYVDARLTTPTTPDELIARYARGPLDFEPGTRYAYSNTGFVILARIVEKVAGRPYAALLSEGIFRPLGMASATLERPATAATGHVVFLVDDPAPAPLEARGWLFGIGDIWASAADLARWDLALAEGKLLSAGALASMTTARSLASGRSTGYGCGLGVRTVDGETVWSHSGWVGGFHTFNAIVPRTRSAVVLLTNDEHVDLGDLHATILRLVTRDTSAIPEVAGPPAAEAARTLIRQLQRGTVDRATLGEDLAAYYDDARLAAASAILRALGEPSAIEVESRGERGGQEVTSLSITFPNRTLSARMFRTPDGKIRQLLFTP